VFEELLLLRVEVLRELEELDDVPYERVELDELLVAVLEEDVEDELLVGGLAELLFVVVVVRVDVPRELVAGVAVLVDELVETPVRVEVAVPLFTVADEVLLVEALRVVPVAGAPERTEPLSLFTVVPVLVEAERVEFTAPFAVELFVVGAVERTEAASLVLTVERVDDVL